MIQIQLSPQDEHLRTLNWYMTAEGYARRNYVVAGQRRYDLLHRMVLGVVAGHIIDHINGDRLDNRRENLRICTHAQNMQNRKMHRNNAVGMKGVYPTKRGKFCAQIRQHGTKVHLGTYSTATEAKQMYDAAAKKLHQEFARLT